MKILLIILSLLFTAAVSGQKIAGIVDPEFTDTLPPVDPPDTTVIPGIRNIFFECTWEIAGDYDKWHHTPATHCCAYSQVIETDTFNSTHNAMRFVLLKAGAAPADLAAGSKRSELDINSLDPVGAERWYGFSMYFPSTKYGFDNSREIIFQKHHQGSTGSPPLALSTLQDQFVLVTRLLPSDPDQNHFLGAVPKNQWVDFVVHDIARDDAGGLIQIWIDGSLVYDVAGQSSFTGQKEYPKTGIYKWEYLSNPNHSSQSERVLYMDDFRIGDGTSSFADVAP